MKRSLVGLAVLLSLASLLAGCGGSPTVSEVRWELERRFPQARFEPEEHVHLGRFTMGLLHGVVRLAAAHDEDGREGAEIFRQIHSVDVASYKVHNLPALDGLAADTRFARELKAHGWSQLVRTHEENESTWVYVRGGEDGVLNNLFVVSLEKDELTLVRVDGRLDKMIAMAMAEHPKKMFDGGHKGRKGEVRTVAVREP
ncbi:MAG TPA: DUF4252 domain-containing protein [Thermoanaerobaculia bacterium]|nr:DUF4252 domain-containing protein [Thermoanaerobaculia bacterium]